MVEVKTMLSEIHELLISSGEKQWAGAFAYFINRIQGQGIDAIKREILAIYAGMGSFNDLVLYKNGTVLRMETMRLHELRQELFSLLTNG